MQYIQLQQQPEGDIPNASASGSMNLFVNNGCITLKDDASHVIPQCGGGGSALDSLQMELGWNSGSTIGVNGGHVISKGLGKGPSNTASYVYLRFKLKIGSDLNGWSYTKPLAKIKLMWEFQYEPGFAYYLPQLNYKYV